MPMYNMNDESIHLRTNGHFNGNGNGGAGVSGGGGEEDDEDRHLSPTRDNLDTHRDESRGAIPKTQHNSRAATLPHAPNTNRVPATADEYPNQHINHTQDSSTTNSSGEKRKSRRQQWRRHRRRCRHVPDDNTDSDDDTDDNEDDGDDFAAAADIFVPQSRYKNGGQLSTLPCNEVACRSVKLVDVESSSSSSSCDENDLLSVSDDGCIYTYKRDHCRRRGVVVDALHENFINLDLNLPSPLQPQPIERNSSPEMDFLEMDFDPGPSADSDSNADAEPSIAIPAKPSVLQEMVTSKPSSPVSPHCATPSPPAPNKITQNCENPPKSPAPPRLSLHKKIATESSAKKQQNGRHSNTKQMNSFVKYSYSEGVATVATMIWSENDARRHLASQTSTNRNVNLFLDLLKALRIPLSSAYTPDLIEASFFDKTRSTQTMSLVDFLVERSRAGCTHRDIILALSDLNNANFGGGGVYARFFATYPERGVDLRAWLWYWIRGGAVPILTLAVESAVDVDFDGGGGGGGVCCCDFEGDLKGYACGDVWVHRMVYGVDASGVFLTNPLGYVTFDALWPQLCAKSVRRVRVCEVVERLTCKSDDLFQLGEMMDDVRWAELNVLGQVVRVARESLREARSDQIKRHHITIPTDYKTGVTLTVPMDSPTFPLLRQTSELPLLSTPSTTLSSPHSSPSSTNATTTTTTGPNYDDIANCSGLN